MKGFLKRYGAVMLNLTIIISGICGLYFSIFGSGFMNSDTFLYYTVQSNILAMITAAVALIFEIRRIEGHAIPAPVHFLRYISAIAIALTYLVFSVMLTPVMVRAGNIAYLTSAGNLLVHKVVPICAMLDWFLFGSARKFKRRCAVCGMIPAILYVCFVFICVASGITFSGNIVPYFFLDFKTYGWLGIGNGGIGVVYWILILAGLLIALGFLFRRLCRKRSALDHNSCRAE